MAGPAREADLDPASAVQLLATLHDIDLPQRASDVQSIPGSAVLVLAMVLLIGSWLLWRWRLHQTWQRFKLRRQALRRYRSLSARLHRDPTDREAIALLSQLLRRIALSVYPRAQVAGLCGGAWLSFLDAHSPVPLGFSEGPGKLLASEPYLPATSSHARVDHGVELEPCLNLVEAWLRYNLGGGASRMPYGS